jgi:hypothetical protein
MNSEYEDEGEGEYDESEGEYKGDPDYLLNLLPDDYLELSDDFDQLINGAGGLNKTAGGLKMLGKGLFNVGRFAFTVVLPTLVEMNERAEQKRNEHK